MKQITLILISILFSANILSLGARFMKEEEIYDVIKTWLSEPFEGGRHQRRIEKLDS